MSDYQQIPASAWDGVQEPTGKEHMDCPSCGNEDVRVVSFIEMTDRSVNANTFLVPGRLWGYVECLPCEQRQAMAMRPWWRRISDAWKKR